MMAPVFWHWQLTLDLPEESLYPATWEEAVRWARTAEDGALSAEGQNGDWAELEFTAHHAEVWYLGTDQLLRRPYFPHRTVGDPSGADSSPVSRSGPLTREEGFRLFGTLLRGGGLPAAVPDDRPGQPLLPGMGELAAEAARSRALTWPVQCHANDAAG